MRREVRSARPPLFRGENFLYGSDYGRDRRFRAQSRLGSDGVFNESSRTVCYAIKGTASRFEIRADNGRFRKPEGFPNRFCVAGRKSQEGHFFRDPFAVRTRFAFVSLRQACYRHVLAFSIPVFSLGMSVESPVLEIACLDSRSGLILGESHRDFLDIVGSLIISTRGVARSRFESSMFWESWLEYPVVSSRSSAGVYIPVFLIFRKNTACCGSVSLGIQVGCSDGHYRRNFHGDP